MWTGEGWTRTQRQLGVFLLLALVVADAGFGVRVFVGIYGIIATLLGLDVIAGALANNRPGGRR